MTLPGNDHHGSSLRSLISVGRRSSLNLLFISFCIAMILASPAWPQTGQTNTSGHRDLTGATVDDAPIRLNLFGEGQLTVINGFVSAREFDIEGDRFHFGDLNVHVAQKASVGVQFNKSGKTSFEGLATYVYLRGSTTITSDKVFNQTTLQGGTGLDSEPDWLELRFTYLHRLSDVNRGKGSVWLVLGVDYHYINWNFGATVAPGSIGDEPSEDFFVQTFPLPVLGLRYLTRLSPTWSLDLRVDGFRANHWRHWNDEGGPIHTSSTIMDALGTLRWQVRRNFFGEFGYRFNYYTLDETGPEDGNHLQVKAHGPIGRLGYSF